MMIVDLILSHISYDIKTEHQKGWKDKIVGHHPPSSLPLLSPLLTINHRLIMIKSEKRIIIKFDQFTMS